VWNYAGAGWFTKRCTVNYFLVVLWLVLRFLWGFLKGFAVFVGFQTNCCRFGVLGIKSLFCIQDLAFFGIFVVFLLNRVCDFY